ncbi:S8 family serine peptidase [bacterium]|nr:S8 family serine peptidase [bacterium]
MKSITLQKLCLAFALFFVIGQALTPEKELLLHFRSSTVFMPSGLDSCTIGQLTAPDTVKTILSQLGADYVLRGVSEPSFNPADTITISGDDTLRFPDLTALFVIGFSSTSERDSALGELDTILSQVISVQKNSTVGLREYIPDDPEFWRQWPFKNTGDYANWVTNEDIRLTKAWEYSLANRNIEIGVTDCGIDNTHWELNALGKVKYKNQNWAEVTPAAQHGTRVAGIIAAEQNNGTYGDGLGISGVAPLATLYSGKWDTWGPEDEFQAMAADAAKVIRHCSDRGDPVINASWGFPYYYQVLEDACIYAYNNGSLVVTAGETDYQPGPSLDHFRNSVLSVAGLKSNGVPCSYGIPHSNTSVCAPAGESSNPLDLVYTTEWTLDDPPNDNDYVYEGGTSFGAPIVSGVCALLKDLNPLVEPCGIWHGCSNFPQEISQHHLQAQDGILTLVMDA